MPLRTQPGGNFRFKRTFPGVGPIRLSANTKSRVEFRARDGVLTKLHNANRLDLLRDFQSGKLAIEELMDFDRRGELLRATTQDAVVRRPLWDLVDDTLPLMGKKASTRTRYRGVLQRLKDRALLGSAPALVDVSTADWGALRSAWPGGPSDWNNLGRALSRLLTLVLKSKHHAIRLAFIEAFPTEREVERVPDIAPETFHRVVAKAPEWIRPVYYCLLATGMRIEEYTACDETHLLPETRSLRVPGHKTDRVDILPIAKDLWPWVVAAIPAPVGVERIRAEWWAAQQAAGLTQRHTLHDIRHVTGQLLADAGLSEAQIGLFLRHASNQSTRRYTRRKLRNEDAQLLAKMLGKGPKRGPTRLKRSAA